MASSYTLPSLLEQIFSSFYSLLSNIAHRDYFLPCKSIMNLDGDKKIIAWNLFCCETAWTYETCHRVNTFRRITSHIHSSLRPIWGMNHLELSVIYEKFTLIMLFKPDILWSLWKHSSRHLFARIAVLRYRNRMILL